jgi:DNA-binding transcriptional ArsR family regulator
MANDLPAPPALAPVSDAVALMHALGQPIGWNALRLLASAGPQSVNDVAAALNCAQVSASRHLDALRKAGAVIAVTPPDGDGRKVFYAIPPGRLRETANGKEIDYGVCVLRLA